MATDSACSKYQCLCASHLLKFPWESLLYRTCGMEPRQGFLGFKARQAFSMAKAEPVNACGTTCWMEAENTPGLHYRIRKLDLHWSVCDHRTYGRPECGKAPSACLSSAAVPWHMPDLVQPIASLAHRPHSYTLILTCSDVHPFCAPSHPVPLKQDQAYVENTAGHTLLQGSRNKGSSHWVQRQRSDCDRTHWYRATS